MPITHPQPHAAWTGDVVHRVTLDACAVIGDIHGRADLLVPLLRLLDRPILVIGDVCDRGPDTRTCVQALIDRDAVGVLGNHDLWFAKWASGHGFEDYALSPRIGGAATMASYRAGPRDWERVPRGHSRWVNALHLVIDLDVAGDPYWLVHAGLPSDHPVDGRAPHEVVPHLAHTEPADLLWRKNDPETMLGVDRPVVMGHWPMPEPLDTGDVVAIDTGAGASFDRLTAVLLPERRFITLA